MSITIRKIARLFILAIIPFCLILPTIVEAAPVIKSSHTKNKKRIITCDNYSRTKLLAKAKKYQDLIKKSAQNYKVSPHLITAVITVESCFRSRAYSSAGAAGLMQLMPATARRFGVSKRKRYNSKLNITAGTKYLKFLLNRYKGNVSLAAAAYNAGEGSVDRYNGIPPYKETKDYVKKVIKTYKKLSNTPLPNIPRHRARARVRVTQNIKATLQAPRVKQPIKVRKVRNNKLAKNAKSQAWYIRRYEQQQLRKNLKLSIHEIKHATRLLQNKEEGITLNFKQIL